jgi:hypothetical protein
MSRLRVLTAAPSRALIALATVKDRLGITGSTEDTRLTDLIAEASSAIVTFLGRDLARQRYEESIAGHGRLLLQLARFPVDRDSVTMTVDAVAVAATDFAYSDHEIGHLFRGIGWPLSSDDDDRNNVVVTYKAGYVLPDQIRTWATALTLAAGDWLRPTSPALSPLLFEITTAGASGSGSEPTWPTTAGTTVTAGTAVATAREAWELPEHLRSLAWLAVQAKYAELSRIAGLASQSGDGFSESYFRESFEYSLPPSVCHGLEQWRF